VTDIYPGNQPHGQFWVRITNNGPGTLQNVKVNIVCSSERTDRNNGKKSSAGKANLNVNMNLAPGQTKNIATGLKLDTNVFDYQVRCQVKPGFNDPKNGNNTYKEALKTKGGGGGNPGGNGGQWKTDVALTDIYAGKKPHGQFWVRVTNHGPGVMKNVQLPIVCGYNTVDKNTGLFGPSDQKFINVKLSLKPGQTKAFPTKLSLDTNTFEYYVGCSASPQFNDTNNWNNHRNEVIK
jgi:hypothetical protein